VASLYLESISIQFEQLPNPIEPMFASMAVFDLDSKKRISEFLYFDLTSGHSSRLLGEKMVKKKKKFGIINQHIKNQKNSLK
jgi:hypothetical protein